MRTEPTLAEAHLSVLHIDIYVAST